MSAGSQVTAADPTRSAWVSASAGTGKTYVLVNRIARLLLAGTAPGRILCLTFTKAAAAEMANRLDGLLGKWAVTADGELAGELGRLTGAPPTDHEMDRARRLFAETLEAPGGLHIRTIHAFCESLLGRFPLEAGVAPHFSVIDERGANELLGEARDLMLARAFSGDSPELGAALEHVAGLVDEAGFAGAISELAGKRDRLRALLGRWGGPQGLIRGIHEALGLNQDDDRDSVIGAACDDGAFDGDGLARACRALETGSAGDAERAAAIAGWLAGKEERATGFDAYRKIFLKDDGGPRAESRLITKKAQKTDPGALDILGVEQARLVAVGERLKAVFVAGSTAALIRLGAVLLESYESLKKARAVLDYDDLILTARDLLRVGGGASWVHYKLDGGLDHILVDEAQDTSPEQWELIAALAGEFFAGSGASEVPRTVFAVGDEKQSIFSFQGAAPEAFERMGAHFKANAEESGDKWRSEELSTSFRSTATVLAAVDRTFRSERASDGLSSGDRPVRHLTNRKGQAGLFELWPTVKPAGVADADPWDAPLDHVSQTSPPARLAAGIADRIDGWLKDGEILESTGRPIRPDDFLILVRTRSAFFEEMVRCLKERMIPVAGADRMVLTGQMAVMDLVALGRFALLPEDDLNLAVVLKGPLIGFDDDDLFTLAHRRRGSLWEALKRRVGDAPRFAEAADRLAGIMALADFVPPYEFFAEVLGPGGGRRRLLARLGPDAADPIDELLNLALDHERRHVPSLEGFLHWLEAGEAEIKRDLETGRGEVRVMTVHGAKGLQANIVILPDTCGVPGARHDARLLWGGDGGPPMLWPSHREFEEETCRELRQAEGLARQREYRRLLYVAMTRARDRLYVGGWETRIGRPDGCWHDLVSDAVAGHAESVPLAEGEAAWRLDDPQTAAPDDAEPVEPAPAETGEPPPWAHRPPAAEADPPRPLAPSRPTDDEPSVVSPLGSDDGVRFKRGRLIHRLLQSLPDLPPGDRAAAAAAYLARPVHGLSEAARGEIAAETLAVLDHPDFGALFGPGSRAEVPLCGVVSGRVVSARLDRLVVSGRQVWVVDYKTNRPPPSTEDEVPAVYLRQMAAYREALRGVYPDHRVRCLLVWTDGPRPMALSDRLLDRYAP